MLGASEMRKPDRRRASKLSKEIRSHCHLTDYPIDGQTT
jgi:hypothetical protein